jgi:hypothetical protein
MSPVTAASIFWGYWGFALGLCFCLFLIKRAERIKRRRAERAGS